MITRIDAHQHYWRISARAGYWPPAELGAIYRDFGAADLAPELDLGRIDGTVLVQSLPSDEDTQYLLDVAERTDTVRAVVGWVDLKAADAADRIARFAAHPKARGLRPMLQDLPDDSWIDDPGLDNAVDAMRAHGLCFDALVMPRHLNSLHAFALRYPDLPIVIDHGAKPDIGNQALEPWLQRMARLARLPNVHCKLSGLWTQAGASTERSALRKLTFPYVRALADLFGHHRLMWGSDWPVLRLAANGGGYGEWLAACEEDCEGLYGPAARADIFGGNAYRIYRIGTRTHHHN